MTELIETAVGVVVTIVLSLGVRKFVERVVPKAKQPETINDKTWIALTNFSDSGKWIGRLESLLSFVSFSITQFLAAGLLSSSLQNGKYGKILFRCRLT